MRRDYAGALTASSDKRVRAKGMRDPEVSGYDFVKWKVIAGPGMRAPGDRVFVLPDSGDHPIPRARLED
jgi:hypothetical protein